MNKIKRNKSKLVIKGPEKNIKIIMKDIIDCILTLI